MQDEVELREHVGPRLAAILGEVLEGREATAAPLSETTTGAARLDSARIETDSCMKLPTQPAACSSVNPARVKSRRSSTGTTEGELGLIARPVAHVHHLVELLVNESVADLAQLLEEVGRALRPSDPCR